MVDGVYARRKLTAQKKPALKLTLKGGLFV